MRARTPNNLSAPQLFDLRRDAVGIRPRRPSRGRGRGRAGAYFLSVTYTTSIAGPDEYHDTLVFRSTNPFDFGTYGGDEREILIRLRLHAPEYVRDPDTDRWYVTSAGWPGDLFGAVLPGAVAITELEWVEG